MYALSIENKLLQEISGGQWTEKKNILGVNSNSKLEELLTNYIID